MPLIAGIAAVTIAAAVVPSTASTTPPAAAPVTGSSPAAGTVAAGDYVVRRGDSTYTIARRAGTTVQAVVAANALPAGGRRIHPGQRLVIPVPGAASATKAAAPTTSAPIRRVQAAGPASPTAARRAAATPRPAPTTSRAAQQAQVRALIEQVAAEHGVDRRLALAVGLQESGWRQDVTSHVGARGAMQVMPANARWASALAGRRLDLGDARDNVTAGVVILKQLQATAGSEDAAIGAYYQGLPSVTQRGMYRETRRYVASVKAHRSRM